MPGGEAGSRFTIRREIQFVTTVIRHSYVRFAVQEAAGNSAGYERLALAVADSVDAGLVIGAGVGILTANGESEQWQAVGVMWGCVAFFGRSGAMGLIESVQDARQAFCDPHGSLNVANTCEDFNHVLQMFAAGLGTYIATYLLRSAQRWG